MLEPMEAAVCVREAGTREPSKETLAQTIMAAMIEPMMSPTAIKIQ